MKIVDSTRVRMENPQLDPKRIDRLLSFQRRMERVGLSFRTEYRVQPALGSLASSTIVNSTGNYSK